METGWRVEDRGQSGIDRGVESVIKKGDAGQTDSKREQRQEDRKRLNHYFL